MMNDDKYHSSIIRPAFFGIVAVHRLGFATRSA
jgi:hypothetical protein